MESICLGAAASDHVIDISNSETGMMNDGDPLTASPDASEIPERVLFEQSAAINQLLYSI